MQPMCYNKFVDIALVDTVYLPHFGDHIEGARDRVCAPVCDVLQSDRGRMYLFIICWKCVFNGLNSELDQLFSLYLVKKTIVRGLESK